MSQQQTTTQTVGGQEACLRQMPAGFGGMGAIEHQPAFPPLPRRAIMAAVNTAARALGLRPASVMVLDALLSCLPCQNAENRTEAPVTPLTLLTIYASNATLCLRAKGITDRQLRRHLDRLEVLGLIRRRDSANGKRFPVKRGGKVVGAFGIDLSPLFARSVEIIALAEEHRKQVEELRGVKACIQQLRQNCLTARLDEAGRSFVEGVTTLLRRATLTLTEAYAVLSRLQSLAVNGATATQRAIESPRVQPSETDDLTANDGQNVRHKETHHSETHKQDPQNNREIWQRLPILSSFFPEVPDTTHHLLRVVHDFGRMLGLRDGLLAQAVQKLGLWRTLALQDQLAGKLEQIRNPNGYLSAIVGSPGRFAAP